MNCVVLLVLGGCLFLVYFTSDKLLEVRTCKNATRNEQTNLKPLDLALPIGHTNHYAKGTG